MDKKLYPLKFLPIASRRPWGGNFLAKQMGKKFSQTTPEGEVVPIAPDTLVGESWEIADMGQQDSVIANGFLAGNTIAELMETYMERVVGDDVFEQFGTQFPLLIKYLDITGKLSVQVHPDDVVAAERYDQLGKTEVWYIMDAQPDAKIYMGLSRDVSAQEFYDACKSATADRILNVIRPRKGDVIFINPGTVHAAEGGIVVCEIQESSDMTFRLYDWGREFNPATARKMHLEEAFDIINLSKYDAVAYTPAQEAKPQKTDAAIIADCPQFTVSRLTLYDDMEVKDFDSFLVYNCLEGQVSLQYSYEGRRMALQMNQGDTVLVPAEADGFILSPLIPGSVLLESTVRPRPEVDSYTKEIN